MADSTSTTKQQFLETALGTIVDIDQILSKSSPETALVSPSELYAYAVDAQYRPTDALMNALETNSETRTNFHRLLQNTARYHMPQVAAASSGTIEQREAEGCKISFRPSKADEKQIYVIIESVGNLEFSPAILFVCDPDGTSNRIELPEAQNGRIQLLMDRDSETAQGLLDIKNEVYLK